MLLVNDELEIEEDMKTYLVGSNAKLEKDINNFQQRQLSFENLMVETGQQIEELREDKTNSH